MPTEKGEVLLKFKADTKQAESRFKRFVGSATSAANSVNEITDALGKVGAGFALAGKALEAYGKQQRLLAAAAGADIGRIEKATGGLITRMQALELAAKAQANEFAINQKQMENVAKFMIVLRNRGFETQEAFEKVTEAVLKADAGPLEDFGVRIEANTGTLQAHNQILKEIEKQNAFVGDSMERAGDNAARAAISWQNAVDELMTSFGALAQEIAPLIDIVNDGIKGVVALIREIRGATGSAGNIRMQTVQNRIANLPAEVAAQQIQQLRAQGVSDAEIRRRIGANPLIQSFDERNRQRRQQLAQQQARQAAERARRAALRPGGRGRGGRDLAAFERGLTEGAGPFSVAGAPGAQTFGEGAGGLGQFNVFEHGFEGSGLLPGAAPGGRQQDQQMQATIEALSQSLESLKSGALNAFTQASSQAFLAWTEGSLSAGKALDSFVGQALRGLAAEMAVRAALHAAQAIGSAASLNFPAAATHAAAAAAFGAGAALANKLAGKFGGSGNIPTTGALPSAARGAVGGGAGGGGQRAITIAVGQSPLDDDPRASRRRISEALDRANKDHKSAGLVVRA